MSEKNKIEDINSSLTALIEELLRTINIKLHRYNLSWKGIHIFKALFYQDIPAIFHFVIQIKNNIMEIAENAAA